jgi:dihydroxyacetone synthase
MGMAAIGVALWKYVMRYAPHTPNWVNRDRFVLSNGHTCLFQYAFLHLSGYKAMTFEQLKSYHSDRMDSLCAGHPEIECEGIEVTTGQSCCTDCLACSDMFHQDHSVKGLQMR